MIHEARIVPLSKMPPLDGAIQQWLGSSRGHWEGNKLVVETTNFNGQTSMTDVPTRGSPRDPRASSTQMKLVETFERTGDNGHHVSRDDHRSGHAGRFVDRAAALEARRELRDLRVRLS